MILTFDNVGWFFDIIRNFFAHIDYVIYALISWIIEGIFNLSNLLVNPDFVKIIYNRIYVIIAIFMVFKLAFSFLQYMVSPDNMTDKEKGVGKLVMKIVVSLSLLILLPIVFFNPDLIQPGKGTVLNVLQTGLIETIPKIVLGIGVDSSTDQNANSNSVVANADQYGNDMAISMLSSFYYPVECKKNGGCAADDSFITTFDEFLDRINKDDNVDGVYDYQYMWPLTTVAGILLVIILVGLAIDVAIRTFKLIILQMIAPIPIMMNIDPKSAKDSSFNSWGRTFISTYVDIFVKLATVYLLLLLVSKLFESGGNGLFSSGIDSVQGFMSRNFVRVFLVIGLFKFAKDAPKFIKDALGMKDNGSGGGTMGKALSGLAGAAAGFAGGVATGGLAGGLSGVVSGYSAGLAGNAGKAFSQVRDEQAKLLGKTPGGVKGKIQNAAMRSSVMKHTGLNKDSLKAAKEDMIKKQNLASQYAADFQHYGFVPERDADGNVVRDANGNVVSRGGYDIVTSAQKSAAKAQSNYEAANSIAGQIGLKPNFFEENKRHGYLYRAINKAVARGNGIDNIANLPTDMKDVWYSESTYTDLSTGESYTGYEAVEKARDAYKTEKADYDKALSGGFGPITSEKRAASVPDTKADKKTSREILRRTKKGK